MIPIRLSIGGYGLYVILNITILFSTSLLLVHALTLKDYSHRFATFN